MTAVDTKVSTPRDISPEELRRGIEADEVTLIDVREPDEHAREHIACDRLVPAGDVRPDTIRAHLTGRPRVAFYCRSGRRSADAAARVCGSLDAGVEVVNLQGGIEAWRKAGLPTEKDPTAPLPLMRQVQIAAGSLVVAGAVLAAFVAPGFIWLSAFVGAGLIFAGATGWCGMATLLEQMPWNSKAQKCGGGSCAKG